MKSKPLTSKVPNTKLDEFISGAEQRKVDAVSSNKTYPWENNSVRNDVNKLYNLRLPEPYLLKLKYISQNTPASMQSFCLDILLPEIDKRIKELTGK